MQREPYPLKTRISAVIYTHILKSLDAFQKNMGLKSRSAAVAEALADWAQECERENRVQKAITKYGSAYEAAAEWEEKQAEKMLPLIKATRHSP